MKETNASLTNALKIERDTNSKLQKRMESFNSKYTDMKAQYESMLKENKSYGKCHFYEHGINLRYILY